MIGFDLDVVNGNISILQPDGNVSIPLCKWPDRIWKVHIKHIIRNWIVGGLNQRCNDSSKINHRKDMVGITSMVDMHTTMYSHTKVSINRSKDHLNDDFTQQGVLRQHLRSIIAGSIRCEDRLAKAGILESDECRICNTYQIDQHADEDQQHGYTAEPFIDEEMEGYVDDPFNFCEMDLDDSGQGGTTHRNGGNVHTTNGRNDGNGVPLESENPRQITMAGPPTFGEMEDHDDNPFNYRVSDLGDPGDGGHNDNTGGPLAPDERDTREDESREARRGTTCHTFHHCKSFQKLRAPFLQDIEEVRKSAKRRSQAILEEVEDYLRMPCLLNCGILPDDPHLWEGMRELTNSVDKLTDHQIPYQFLAPHQHANEWWQEANGTNRLRVFTDGSSTFPHDIRRQRAGYCTFFMAMGTNLTSATNWKDLCRTTSLLSSALYCMW